MIHSKPSKCGHKKFEWSWGYSVEQAVQISEVEWLWKYFECSKRNVKWLPLLNDDSALLLNSVLNYNHWMTNGVSRTTKFRSRTIMNGNFIARFRYIKESPQETEDEDWDVTQHFYKVIKWLARIVKFRRHYRADLPKKSFKQPIAKFPSRNMFPLLHVYCLLPDVGVEKIIKRWKKSTLYGFVEQSRNLILIQNSSKLNQRKMSIKLNLFPRL